MKEYPAYGKYSQGSVLLDDGDADFLHLAGIRLNAKPNGYAFFWRTENGKTKNYYLHRFITNAPEDFDVDHADGNKLNNTRENLRVCRRGQNMANLDRESKGVYPHGDKWHAKIMKDYKSYHLGTFDTKEEAIDEYNQRAEELFGEYARESYQ